MNGGGSVIKDPSLAEGGIDKINWVRDFMPGLRALESRLASEKPFEGLKITMSIHLEAKTAVLALLLKSGGAEVRATGCNPLSTQDDVAAGLAKLGVSTFASYGVGAEEYEAQLVMALEHRPNLIIDDGGDLVEILSGKRPDLASELIGGCEETTTGVHRLRARAAAKALGWPMMNVNGAACKRLFDNKYGTGQSSWDAIMHTTNLLVAGKKAVISGFGHCGRGLAMRARGLGATVIITEVDPVYALEAHMEGYEVMPMSEACKIGDIFISATGCRDIITKEHFPHMKNNALLCNAGHFDVEINTVELAEAAVEVFERRKDIRGYKMPDGRVLNLIAEGRLVNLAAGNGHPAEIMDMSFMVQCLSLEYILKNRGSLEKTVYDVPREIDEAVAAVQLEALGLEIDTVTEAQRQYLEGWEVN